MEPRDTAAIDAVGYDRLWPVLVALVLLVGGSVAVELLAERRSRELKDAVVIRLEQLYPFPNDALAAELAKYPNAKDLVWCQEEPRNQGAWYWIASRQHFVRSMSDKHELHLVSRPASASPAVGYYAVHNAQQREVVEGAFGPLGQDQAPRF